MDSVASSDLVVDDTLGDAGRQVVGSYKTYLDAQRAVDRLSDASFPVESVEIVGRDLRFVEKVTGRMSSGRASAAGAGSGAWFGLFIGLLVGLFTPAPEWIWLILIGVVVGAVWGAVFATSPTGRCAGTTTSRRPAAWPPTDTTSWSSTRRSSVHGVWFPSRDVRSHSLDLARQGCDRCTQA